MLSTENLLSLLSSIYAHRWSDDVEALLLRPPGEGVHHSYVDALEALGEAGIQADMLPLSIIDELSVACVALNDRDSFRRGDVIRLFRTDVPSGVQGALFDIDPLLYIASLEEELAARQTGLHRVLDQIGPAYEESHLAREKRPRDYVVRPVRIACQNVIVALGAIAQDSSFDGLAVPAWQTCEVPHVATHEGNRALAALTLCDAFENGGTMEIRFDREVRVIKDGRTVRLPGHPEGAVPASLRRFGRTVGVALGATDPAAITPDEARELFLAITPLPDGLRARVDTAVRRRGITPERVCFLLLSQIWREIEMDFLLATSARAPSILDGGAPWTDRPSRQAESEVCRAAVMAGMYFRRLNATDAAAGGGEVRVVEDRTKGVVWTVHEKSAAITFSGLEPGGSLPWVHGVASADHVTVFARTAVTADAIDGIKRSEVPGPHVLLVPADMPVPPDCPVPVLRCPDRLADIDKSIEDRLLSSRISRG